jgi:hypothetical protein
MFVHFGDFDEFVYGRHTGEQVLAVLGLVAPFLESFLKFQFLDPGFSKSKLMNLGAPSQRKSNTFSGLAFDGHGGYSIVYFYIDFSLKKSVFG